MGKTYRVQFASGNPIPVRYVSQYEYVKKPNNAVGTLFITVDVRVTEEDLLVSLSHSSGHRTLIVDHDLIVIDDTDPVNIQNRISELESTVRSLERDKQELYDMCYGLRAQCDELASRIRSLTDL